MLINVKCILTNNLNNFDCSGLWFFHLCNKISKSWTLRLFHFKSHASDWFCFSPLPDFVCSWMTAAAYKAGSRWKWTDLVRRDNLLFWCMPDMWVKSDFKAVSYYLDGCDFKNMTGWQLQENSPPPTRPPLSNSMLGWYEKRNGNLQVSTLLS